MKNREFWEQQSDLTILELTVQQHMLYCGPCNHSLSHKQEIQCRCQFRWAILTLNAVLTLATRSLYSTLFQAMRSCTAPVVS